MVTAKSRAEVTRKLAKLRREIDAGQATTAKTLTLAELMTRWFEDVLSREVARSTFDNYHTVVKYQCPPFDGKAQSDGHLQPVVQGRFRDAQVPRNLGDRRLVVSSDGDDVSPELNRVSFSH